MGCKRKEYDIRVVAVGKLNLINQAARKRNIVPKLTNFIRIHKSNNINLINAIISLNMYKSRIPLFLEKNKPYKL